MARARGTGFIFQSRYTVKGVVKTATTWSICYRVGRKQIRESSHSTNQADATRLLKKRLAEVGSNKRPADHKIKFEGLAELIRNDYVANNRKSLWRIEQSLKHLAEFFANERAEEIDSDAINRYVTWRKPAANGTINRELAALKRAMNLAKLRPDIKMLQEADARAGFFERSEVESLVSELPEYFKGVLRFAYITGWRVREITTRRWEHVDLDGGWVRLDPGETKSRDGRSFPVTPELGEVLEAQRVRCAEIAGRIDRGVELVFPRDGGELIGQYASVWEKACKKAGLVGKMIHDCRRSAIRNMERAGVPRSTAMAISGHKTASIYSRYAIVDAGSMREAAIKIAALHAGEKKSFGITPGQIERMAGR